MLVPTAPTSQYICLSGDQHILNTAGVARWLVLRWKKDESMSLDLSHCPSIPMALSAYAEYAPLCAYCFLCWLLFINKDLQMYWHWSLLNTSVSALIFQQTLKQIWSFRMWDGQGLESRKEKQWSSDSIDPPGTEVGMSWLTQLFWVTGSLGKQIEQNSLAKELIDFIYNFARVHL